MTAINNTLDTIAYGLKDHLRLDRIDKTALAEEARFQTRGYEGTICRFRPQDPQQEALSAVVGDR